MGVSRSDELEGLVLVADQATETYTPALLFRRHFQDVHRWVRHLAGPGPDVDDLTQEVFVVACRRLDDYRGESKITTWLYGIARNVVRNHRRKQVLRKVFRTFDTQWVEDVSDDHPSPLDEVERQCRERRLYEVLDSMSEKYRTVLVLFELEELDGKAIAERLGIREATVFVQLHRARKIFIEEMRRRETQS